MSIVVIKPDALLVELVLTEMADKVYAPLKDAPPLAIAHKAKIAEMANAPMSHLPFIAATIPAVRLGKHVSIIPENGAIVLVNPRVNPHAIAIRDVIAIADSASNFIPPFIAAKK
jgi:hypothetical protein